MGPGDEPTIRELAEMVARQAASLQAWESAELHVLEVMLRELADQLARHNEVAFVREGIRYSVKVPDEVTFSLEVEVGDDGSEIEVEISW